jgi:hypothetical protein
MIKTEALTDGDAVLFDSTAILLWKRPSRGGPRGANVAHAGHASAVALPLNPRKTLPADSVQWS